MRIECSESVAGVPAREALKILDTNAHQFMNIAIKD